MKQFIFILLLITAIQALGQSADPQNEYAQFVVRFREYLSYDPLLLTECPNCGIYESLPKNPHDFTKEHLNILAHSKMASGYMDGLSVLATRALELKTDANGTPILGTDGKPQFTKAAILAIAALKQVKPASMNLVQFIKAIDEAASQTVGIRYQNDVERVKAHNKSNPAKSFMLPRKGSSTAETDLSRQFPFR